MNKLLELARTKLGCGYVWGAQGETLTLNKLNWFKNTFGTSHYIFNDSQGVVDASKWINKQVFDCSGLILWCLQQLGYIATNQDYNAEMFYKQLCNPISKSELKQGDLVFIKSSSGEITHIGIYAGSGGQVVEAMSTRMGVVIGNVSRFNLYGRLKFNLESEVINMTPQESIKYLSSVGEINNPDLWLKAIEVVKFLDAIFVKYATAVKALKG